MQLVSFPMFNLPAVHPSASLSLPAIIFYSPYIQTLNWLWEIVVVTDIILENTCWV